MVVDTRGTEGLVLDGERERDGFRERGREKFGKKAMRGLGHVFYIQRLRIVLVLWDHGFRSVFVTRMYFGGYNHNFST
jgi:hypothetical protein